MASSFLKRLLPIERKHILTGERPPGETLDKETARRGRRPIVFGTQRVSDRGMKYPPQS